MSLVAVVSAILLAPATATAGPSADEIQAAGAAFAQGQQAEVRRDWAAAAQFFEVAYDAAPSAEALRAAARSRKQAGDLDRAANHAVILRTRYEDPASRELATQILEEAAKALARMDVRCEPACALVLGIRSVAPEPAERHTIYATPGAVELSASFAAGGTRTRQLSLEAGTTTEVELVAPEPSPATAEGSEDPQPAPVRADGSDAGRDDGGAGPMSRKRLSPAWFIGAATVTAGLGAVTVWSGLDVLDGNRDYEAMPTQEALDQGRKDELRTNVLIGATAAVGVATVVLAVFTDWGRWKRNRGTALRTRNLEVDVQTHGAGLGLRGRF